MQKKTRKEGEAGHLQAKVRGLRRNQSCQPCLLILDFQPPELWKMHFCGLSHLVCGSVSVALALGGTVPSCGRLFML